MQAQWLRLINKLKMLFVFVASTGFAGAAVSQVTVPRGKGNITIIFGLTLDGPQEGGPIQVNLIGDKNESERSLVMIGPNCEVAMSHGSIAIGPIDKQLELSRKVGPRRGMAAVATYAQRVGFKLSPQEVECGGRIMEQAARREALKLDWGQ